MQLQYAIDKILELAGKEKLGKEMALEAIALLISYVGTYTHHTVRIEKEGDACLFYSTLPEDVAHFWDRTLLQIENDAQPGMKGCKKIRLPSIAGYEGIWILEMEEREITESQKEEGIFQFAQFFIAACLLSEEAERSRQIDPVTGLLGIEAMEKTVLNQVGQDPCGFLIAVKVATKTARPFQEDGADASIRSLSDVCKSIHSKDLFRMSADTIVVLLNGAKETAFAAMQQIMDQVLEATIILLSISSLVPGNVVYRIQEELGKVENGNKIPFFETAFPFPKLPVFYESTEGKEGT